MPRKGSGQRSAIRAALDAYRARVGPRPIDRMNWAIRVAQQPAGALTPGVQADLPYEIAAFLEAEGYRADTQLVHIPGPGEIEDFRRELTKIFRQLLAGEEIRPQPSLRRPVYRFNRGAERWERWELGKSNFIDFLLEK